MTSRTLHLIATLCCSLLALALIGAQPAFADKGVTPTEDAQARAIFDQFVKRYASIDRRHERAEMTMEIDTDVTMYKMMNGRSTAVWEYKYAAPDRIWIETPGGELICDGESLWVAHEYFGEYMQRPMPERGEIFGSLQEMLGAMGSMPDSLSFLLSGAADVRVSSGTPIVTGHAAETKDDIASVRFDLTVVDINDTSGMFESHTMRGSIWFDVETGAVHTMEFDSTEMMREALDHTRDLPQMASFTGIEPDVLAEDAIRSAVSIMKVETLPTDSIKPEDFEIPNVDSMSRVEKFSEYDSQAIAEKELKGAPSVEDLIGEAAPAVTGTDQFGNRFDLSDHRGEVVLLVVNSMMSREDLNPWIVEAEALGEAFEGMPVTAAAVMTPAMMSFFGETPSVDADEYSIPVITDTDMRVAMQYHTQLSPALVVIDPDGVVQAAHTGLHRIKGENTMVDAVATLLEGGLLYDPAEVRERRERKQAERQRREMVAPSLELVALDEDRLSGRTVRRWGSDSPPPYGAASQVLDVDGDGRQDVVAATSTGALAIISGADQSSRTVQLESIEKRNVSIMAFGRMHGERGDAWVVVLSKRTPFGSQSTEMIGAFRDDGSKLWLRTLRSPNGETIYTNDLSRAISIGDLNGDGLDEIALGLRMSTGIYNAESRDPLLVLDSEGDVLVTKMLQYGAQTVNIVPAEAGRDGWIAVGSITGITRVVLDR